MKVLVTGASGFVGSGLLEQLSAKETFELVACSRHAPQLPLPNSSVRWVTSPELSNDADWSDLLSGVDSVVHLAGRAHVLHELMEDPISEFRRVNLDGTLHLARCAIDAGVKRFIFISSIGVNGSQTDSTPFSEGLEPKPSTDYAFSKCEAEVALRMLAEKNSLELVIIRPPLVYASHAPGNFARLLKLVATGVPLPFSSVCNHRSMIALENFTDFIELCICHPDAANQTFLISDGDEISTPQLIKYLAEGMGLPATLFSVPPRLMLWLAIVARKKGLFDQLCGSLVIDSSKARETLGWRPSVQPPEALVTAGREYRNRNRN